MTDPQAAAAASDAHRTRPLADFLPADPTTVHPDRLMFDLVVWARELSARIDALPLDELSQFGHALEAGGPVALLRGLFGRG